MEPSATTRRSVITGAAASVCAGPALAAESFAAIEARVGGRLGVAAMDLVGHRGLLHRGGERFPMCSTFKAMAVASVLLRVDRGQDRLDRFIRFGKDELLDYAPVAKAHVRAGGMPLGELCAAAIEYSDNTAANLILGAIGGPAGWTSFVRHLGDNVSRLDRTEPALNYVARSDVRDTTTPAAMMTDLRKAVLGGWLSEASRQHLVKWMEQCKTGDARLRAGLPRSWRVADKTGALESAGCAGDIAVAWAPTGPIVIACYLDGATAAPSERDAAIAAVGRLAAETLTSRHG
jgi:beta-lactamase class A